MEDYVDLYVIQRRLRGGHYMNYFSFKHDMRNFFSKALQFMADDTRVEKIVENLKRRYKVMSASL